MSRRRRFVLTPEARADLIQIWSHIAEDSIDAADQALARLHDAFTRLGRTPGMGHQREDLADTRHRFWTVYSYVIVSLGNDTHPNRRRGAAVGSLFQQRIQ